MRRRDSRKRAGIAGKSISKPVVKESNMERGTDSPSEKVQVLEPMVVTGRGPRYQDVRGGYITAAQETRHRRRSAK
jgi:hypothetical protein